MQLTINGAPRDIDVALPTLAAVVDSLALAGKRIAIELNGAIVPRSQYAATPVAAGDRLEIVGAVGGG
jgi:sulfur carrier protein